MMKSRVNNADTNLVSVALSPTEDGGMLPLECATWRANVLLSFSATDQ
jgi:hypothetical protein